MELYILSKKDLSILSICKVCDYQINLDEETGVKAAMVHFHACFNMLFYKLGSIWKRSGESPVWAVIRWLISLL